MTTKEITTELKITARQLRLLIAKGKDGCFYYAGRRFAVEKRGSGHFTKYVFTEVERPAVERVAGRPDLDAMDMSQLKMEKTKSEVRQNWNKEDTEIDRHHDEQREKDVALFLRLVEELKAWLAERFTASKDRKELKAIFDGIIKGVSRE